MTIPTPDDIAALLTPVYAEYNALHRRLTRLSLVQLLTITREHFPTAAFVRVDETDQDMSGSLVTDEEGARDIDDVQLDLADDQHTDEVWCDRVWNALLNLDTSNQGIWHPFFLADLNGGSGRLDLNAIEQAVPDLLSVDEPASRIIKVLDLSTAHLPESLMNGPIGPLNSIEGVIAYAHGEYGFLLWVPDDPQEHADDYPNPADDDVCSDEGVPAEVLAVQLYARGLGCDYVLFDRDADTNADLPTWDW